MTDRKIIFKSRQVNLDQFPYVWPSGTRSMFSVGDGQPLSFDPRPEFEPTRDPLPYWDTETDDDDPIRLSSKVDDPTNSVVWKPRREQFDTPVNRILVYLRMAGLPEDLSGVWLAEVAREVGANRKELEHAWKVLARLVPIKTI